MSDQPEIRFAIEQAFKQLETDKITPWSFFSTGKMKPVEDFHGRTIRYGGSGLAFDGSPRLVFWEFIQPFLEALFMWGFDLALSHSGRRGSDQTEALDTAHQALSSGIYSVFRRMQDIDRRLRGSGSPDKVDQRDVSNEIHQMHTKLKAYYDSAKEAVHKRSGTSTVPSLSDALELKPGISGVSVDLRKVLQWFRARTHMRGPTNGCT